jgi:hypothetical protein
MTCFGCYSDEPCTCSDDSRRVQRRTIELLDAVVALKPKRACHGDVLARGEDGD